MRNFRFRLDPVIRLKKYEIEQVEDEIREMEQQVLDRLEEIEAGRRAVQEMRRRILDETDDSELVKAERRMDLFREYTLKVELQKREEIKEIRKKQEEKRRQLIRLYQEEKVLERLKERRKSEWLAGFRREEGAIMDEIGTQKYIRRERGEAGGVLPYILIAIVLIAAVAGAGIYTGKIDRRALSRIPFLNIEAPKRTVLVKEATSTATIETYTPRDLLGDLDTPMDQTLQNIMDWRDRLNRKEDELIRREKAIETRENLLDRKIEELKESTERIVECIKILQDLRDERDEWRTGELSQFEEELTTALAGAKEKDVVQSLLNLYQSPGVEDAEIKKKNRLLCLRVLHRFSERSRSSMLAEISKQNPNAAAKIYADFATLTSDELNEK